MNGGNPLTSQVSQTLRAAGLPVLRYGDRLDARGRDGIRVANGPFRGGAVVSVAVWADDMSTDRVRDAELEWSDRALEILLGRGFNAQRQDGKASIFVFPAAAATDGDEDVAAVTAASGLNISQPTRNQWLVTVDGQRGAYTIKRTGKDDKARYTVVGRGYGNELAQNLLSMAAAIDTIKQDLEKQ